jgi:transcriptional regulator with XRE-family HTH domain
VSPRKLSGMIKRLREAKGLSQKALATKSGVTDAYIAMIETGKRKNPSVPVLRRLAKALGVPVADLLA